MSYEGDPGKARANFAKHGVRFADAVSVLEDDFALTMRDPLSVEEERWSGPRNRRGLHLAQNNVRLISARPATAREKSQYEEHHET